MRDIKYDATVPQCKSRRETKTKQILPAILFRYKNAWHQIWCHIATVQIKVGNENKADFTRNSISS